MKSGNLILEGDWSQVMKTVKKKFQGKVFQFWCLATKATKAWIDVLRTCITDQF